MMIRRGAVASLVFLAAVSCGEARDPAGPSPVRIAATSVTVSPAVATLFSPGDTVRLRAQALDGQGNAVAGAEFSWASSDGSVVTVDVGGLVTAVSGGTATVTAREGSLGLSGTALLVVADEPRDVLLRVYSALRGLRWTNSDNWGTDAPLGTWYGVTTDEQGRVIELDLSDNGLTGSIPPEIARLATLVVLDLSVTDTTAASQADRGRATRPGRGPDPNPALRLDPGLGPDPARHPDPRDGARLAAADAGTGTPPRAREGLTGPIPPLLGALSRLRTLNLGGNSLTGRMPPELAHLGELQNLDLGRNELTGLIPPELGTVLPV